MIVKNILVIFNQANLTNLQTVESISASMVLATFGCNVSVLLKESALSLLKADLTFNAKEHAFKIGSQLVDGFEFYDIETIYIQSKDKQHPYVLNTDHELHQITLNSTFLQQFDHVLYW